MRKGGLNSPPTTPRPPAPAPQGEPFPYRVIERSLPGRINTRMFPDWDREHGTLCTGCNKVLTSIFAPCECWPPKENHHEHV